MLQVRRKFTSFVGIVAALMLCLAMNSQAASAVNVTDTLPHPPVRLPVLAIMALDSRGVGQNEVSAITDNLVSKLQQCGKFRIMERSQMDQILKEQNFQQSGACDGSQCAVEVGKLLGIDRMVIGSVGLVGNTYTFNLRMIDVGSGEAVRTSARNHKGSIDEVLTDLVPAAVADMADPSQSTTSPMTTQDVPRSPSQAPSDPEKKASFWPWLVGGAVVAGGGAAAVVLLSGKASSAAVPPVSGTATPNSDNHFQVTW